MADNGYLRRTNPAYVERGKFMPVTLARARTWSGTLYGPGATVAPLEAIREWATRPNLGDRLPDMKELEWPAPAGTRKLVDLDRYVGRFQFTSESGKDYVISYDEAIAAWVCDCVGQRNRGTCKHLDRYRPRAKFPHRIDTPVWKSKKPKGGLPLDGGPAPDETAGTRAINAEWANAVVRGVLSPDEGENMAELLARAAKRALGWAEETELRLLREKIRLGINITFDASAPFSARRTVLFTRSARLQALDGSGVTKTVRAGDVVELDAKAAAEAVRRGAATYNEYGSAYNEAKPMTPANDAIEAAARRLKELAQEMQGVSLAPKKSPMRAPSPRPAPKPSVVTPVRAKRKLMGDDDI